MVPGAGIEPARPLSRKILSLVCLPISPSGRRGMKNVKLYTIDNIFFINYSLRKTKELLKPFFKPLNKLLCCLVTINFI